MLTIFNDYLKRLVSLLSWVNITLILPSLVVLILCDVILRAAFSSPIAWAHELSGLLLLTMFFLAIPKCIENEELLSVDLLYQALSSMKRRVLNYLGYVALLLFSLLMIWQAYLGVRDSLEYGDQAYTIDIPYWPFYALMLFIACVTTCQSLVFLVRGGNSYKQEQESV